MNVLIWLMRLFRVDQQSPVYTESVAIRCVSAKIHTVQVRLKKRSEQISASVHRVAVQAARSTDDCRG